MMDMRLITEASNVYGGFRPERDWFYSLNQLKINEFMQWAREYMPYPMFLFRKRARLLKRGDTLAAFWKRKTEKSESMTAQTLLDFLGVSTTDSTAGGII